MIILKALYTPTIIFAIATCGVIGGLFFVFSFSVMDALEQMSEIEGMRAMQLINRTILNPVFLTIFIGSGLACLMLVGVSLSQQSSGYEWIIAGALVYLIGGIGVTAAFNVPLNNALDVLTPGASGSADVWAHYLVRWTQWNTLRTVMSIVGTVLLAIGLRG